MKSVKKLKRKNQWMVGFLALLIAAAGYLNYSGFELDTKEASNTAEESYVRVDDEMAVGETVLTAGQVADYVAKAKLEREQAYGKAKENLQAIIDNTSLSEEAKAAAVEKMAQLSENLVKEAAAEELLGTKGFLNSIVSIGEDAIDVMIQKKEVSKVEKAQIEDIIKRKTGCSLEKIVITTIKTDD